VHAGETSAPRASSLEELEAGGLDVICAVDMFNEGVDLPHVDTVMMLRPTESPVVWLQQLGRGLRRPDGDKVLAVIDYIGNHRTFLLKPQMLLALGPSDADIDRALNALQAGELELPPGCSVTYELEAIEILRALLRKPAQHEALEYYYRDFVERHGVRPRAAEAYHEGYNPRGTRRYHGSWLNFV
jgi:superfamily II DNA or RNA helicase